MYLSKPEIRVCYATTWNRGYYISVYTEPQVVLKWGLNYCSLTNKFVCDITQRTMILLQWQQEQSQCKHYPKKTAEWSWKIHIFGIFLCFCTTYTVEIQKWPSLISLLRPDLFHKLRRRDAQPTLVSSFIAALKDAKNIWHPVSISYIVFLLLPHPPTETLQVRPVSKNDPTQGGSEWN